MRTRCPVTEIPLHNKYAELREEEEEIQQEEEAMEDTALAGPWRACSSGSCQCRSEAQEDWKPSLRHEPKRRVKSESRSRETCFAPQGEEMDEELRACIRDAERHHLSSWIEVTTDSARAVGEVPEWEDV